MHLDVKNDRNYILHEEHCALPATPLILPLVQYFFHCGMSETLECISNCCVELVMLLEDVQQDLQVF